MGSGQSARKLTISNEEEIGVIKVSNAVISRFAQREKAATDEPPSNVRSSTSTQYPPPPPPPSPSSSPPPGVVTANGGPQASDTMSGYPMYYYPQLTVSAHQIEQQMEQELKQQQEYWQKRLQNLEQSYEKINRILEDEYKKTIEDNTGQKVIDIQGTVQPCLENSTKVLKCLQDHPKETLKCSSLVEEFSNCVWNVHYARVIEARS